ncbi:WecB/TagA/CpsF family glycosyltransferase [Crenalkalicoccus roseus]|uniref:WecB/TagA/CpsF family glycosyltransferase n=1 Tax=Crenalkalicoccus roseus TaxID=1485588 RepID=UPI001F0109A6|nr:WecB/TagA/CpsF family glycosyltransferase [Crenalkalicoccus roseus]
MPFDDPLGRVPARPLLGLDFAGLGMEEVLRRLAARPADAPFAYAVTPNADHLVRLSRQPALRPLYEEAALRLLDSRVVARLARGLGLSPPPVVPGSDLTAALFREVIRPGDPLAILGAPPAAVARVADRFGLSRIAHHDPPMGFDADPAALEAALAFLEAHPARFVLLCVGSPRQERVAAALRRRGRASGFGLCVGASLLFLAGLERRAPVVLQRAGLEWAWRLAQDPARLARRYLVDSPAILRLLWREARRGRGPLSPQM